MNKMTKGALAAGLGVALLVCGGWTLAVWNTAVQTQGGTIASGDLKLTAGEGTRKNASGTIISRIAEYKVVPGDNLTFSQTVGVVLYESLLPAKFSVTGPTSNECLTALSKGGMSKSKVSDVRHGVVRQTIVCETLFPRFCCPRILKVDFVTLPVYAPR